MWSLESGSFHLRIVFSRHPRCSIYQYLIPFYGRMIFHCIATLYFVQPYSSVAGPLGCFSLLIRALGVLTQWPQLAGGTSSQRYQGWSNVTVRLLGCEQPRERMLFANVVPGRLQKELCLPTVCVVSSPGRPSAGCHLVLSGGFLWACTASGS